MTHSAFARPFSLGAWRVDPARGVLIAGDQEVRIEPQAMDLLSAFASSPGQVLSKDELIARVWQGRSIGDDTLAAAISKLRALLRETTDNRYIETVPKRGYRLVAPVDDQSGGQAQHSQTGKHVSQLIALGDAALKTPLPQNLTQARLYFENALATDPKSAEAHAGLAEVLLTQHIMGDSKALASAARAEAFAAVGLDESLARAWAVLGFATFLSERNQAQADSALLRAIGLDKDAARARRYRAWVLAVVGRFVEAEREAREAVKREPLDISARNELIQILILSRRYPVAIAAAREALGLGLRAPAILAAKAWSHAFQGQHEEAVGDFLESLTIGGSDSETVVRLKSTFAQKGFEGFCGAGADLLDRQRVQVIARPTDVAMLWTAAGRFDDAIKALSDAVEWNDPFLLALRHHPGFDRLRNDPRFVALLDRVQPVQ